MNGNSTTSILISDHTLVLVKDASVLVKIGDKFETQKLQAGYAGSSPVKTTFLPIEITYGLTFPKPTSSFLFYPIDTALWNGWILTNVTYTMIDESNQTIPFGASTREGLVLLNANCTEPYYAKIDTKGDRHLLEVERTSMPVSSVVPASGFSSGSFVNSLLRTGGLPANVTMTGAFHLSQKGAGIVPASYARASPSLNGAGNAQTAGTYHLTFDTFYNNTSVQLPDSSVTKSFQIASCALEPLSLPNSEALPQNVFSRIYVYDIWFDMPK